MVLKWGLNSVENLGMTLSTFLSDSDNGEFAPSLAPALPPFSEIGF